MEAVEIILILIGVAFLVGSHFVQEKFSEKDIQEISKMSENELKHIVDKQVKSARTQLEDSVDEIIDESLAVTKRGLEKETNEKIMAVSEYSDTVLETMNKTHNEIMFLYSMLNDKQAEVTEVVSAMQKYAKESKKTREEYVPTQEEVGTPSKLFLEREQVMQILGVEEDVEQSKPKAKKKSKTKAKTEVAVPQETIANEEGSHINKNEQILNLYQRGKTEVEIAKTLNCGLGEVKLVIGLYKEDKHEI